MGWLFSGGCSFSIKNKLKSEIFNDKKSLLAKLFFSAITKNLIWEILTKNLVTFKRWDRVQDKKFEYYGGSLKNPIFRGSGGGGGSGGTKKTKTEGIA